MTKAASKIATAAATAAAPATEMKTVEFDVPVQRGDQQIASVKIRRPRAGELRGLSLVDLGQLKVDALAKIIPRITIPMLHEAEVHNLDPADLLQIGAEVGTFLLQKAQRSGAPTE